MLPVGRGLGKVKRVKGLEVIRAFCSVDALGCVFTSSILVLAPG